MLGSHPSSWPVSQHRLGIGRLALGFSAPSLCACPTQPWRKSSGCRCHIDSSGPLGLFLSSLVHVSCHVVLQRMCALECLAAQRALQYPLPPGKVPCKLVCRLGNAIDFGEVFWEALAVSKDHVAFVAHCALVLGLLGRFLLPAACASSCGTCS